MAHSFVLIHSLLLGPSTWTPVSFRLAAAGAPVVVPALLEVAEAQPPFWPLIVKLVNEAVSGLPADRPVVLVAHSNAGVFLPVIAQSASRPVAGCLFVDGRLPARIGPTPNASPERLAVLRSMAVDGRLPEWTTWWPAAEIARILPDPEIRRVVIAEQPRLRLSYYEQQIPAPDDWDALPCGYLLFGPPYDQMARDARGRGWKVDHVPGRHLHQLVDPDAVAARITVMTSTWTA